MIANFDEQAAEYHTRATIQHDLAGWTAEWLEQRASGLDAVEFGAGTGHFTKFVARTGARLRAVDLSSRMVQIGALKEPRACWEMGDAWKPSQFKADRILSCGLLQWCPDPIAVLSRWKSCMRDNGRLLSGLFVCDTMPEFSQALPGIEPFDWRNKEEWQVFFEKAGFNVARAEASKREYHFENACAVLRYLHRIGAVETGRFSMSVLLRALRDYDAAFEGSATVVSTWTFLRIECLCGETN